jgi:hypothetical protein
MVGFFFIFGRKRDTHAHTVRDTLDRINKKKDRKREPGIVGPGTVMSLAEIAAREKRF